MTRSDILAMYGLKQPRNAYDVEPMLYQGIWVVAMRHRGDPVSGLTPGQAKALGMELVNLDRVLSDQLIGAADVALANAAKS